MGTATWEKGKKMRLIDAEKLMQMIPTEEYNARMVIANAPTVDAVPTDFHDRCMQIEIEKRFGMEEVVHCKDCKHNYHNMIPSGEAEYGCTKCIELPITADFYCAWGEREDEE